MTLSLTYRRTPRAAVAVVAVLGATVGGGFLADAAQSPPGQLPGTEGEKQVVREMTGRLQITLADSWAESASVDRIAAACGREGLNFAAYNQQANGAALIRTDMDRVQRRLDAMRIVYEYFLELRTAANQKSVAQANRLISELRDKFVEDAVTQVTTTVVMPGTVTLAGKLTLEVHNAIVDVVGHPVTGQEGHLQDAAGLAQTGATLQRLDALVRRYNASIESLRPEIHRLQRVRATLGECAKAFAPPSASAAPPPATPIPGLLVAREYWDAAETVLKREYQYVMRSDGRERIRNGFERVYYSSGKLSYEATRRDNRLEGPMTRYWENGQKFDVATYKEGSRQGRYEAFQSDGKPRAEGQFDGNRKVGHWKTYHPNGKPETDGWYPLKFDVVEQIGADVPRNADADKGLYFNWGQKVGPWTYYYFSGRKKQETVYPLADLPQSVTAIEAGFERNYYDNEANSVESERGSAGVTEWYESGQMKRKCSPGGGPCRSWKPDGTEERP